MKYESVTAADYRYHDEDTPYDGWIKRLEESESDYGAGFRWVFDIQDEEVWAFSSQIFNNRSKLGQWAAKILGEAIYDGGFDTDSLAGEPVTVMFEYNTTTAGDLSEKIVSVKGREGVKKIYEPDTAPF